MTPQFDQSIVPASQDFARTSQLGMKFEQSPFTTTFTYTPKNPMQSILLDSVTQYRAIKEAENEGKTLLGDEMSKMIVNRDIETIKRNAMRGISGFNKLEQQEQMDQEDIETIDQHIFIAFPTEDNSKGVEDIKDELERILKEPIESHDFLSKRYQYMGLVALAITDYGLADRILKLEDKDFTICGKPRKVTHASLEKVWKVCLTPVSNDLTIEEVREALMKASIQVDPLAMKIIKARKGRDNQKWNSSSEDKSLSAILFLEQETDLDILLAAKKVRIGQNLPKFIPLQNMTHDMDIIATIISPIPQAIRPEEKVKKFCLEQWKEIPYKMVQNRQPQNGDLKRSFVLLWKKSALSPEKLKQITSTNSYKWESTTTSVSVVRNEYN